MHSHVNVLFIYTCGTTVRVHNVHRDTDKSPDLNMEVQQDDRTNTQDTNGIVEEKKTAAFHDRSQRTSWLNCLALDSRRPPACVCCQGDCLWALIAYNCTVTQRARSCSLSSSQNHVEAKYNLDQTSLCRSTKLVINLTRGTHQNKMHRSDTIN